MNYGDMEFRRAVRATAHEVGFTAHDAHVLALRDAAASESHFASIMRMSIEDARAEYAVADRRYTMVYEALINYHRPMMIDQMQDAAAILTCMRNDTHKHAQYERNGASVSASSVNELLQNRIIRCLIELPSI